MMPSPDLFHTLATTLAATMAATLPPSRALAAALRQWPLLAIPFWSLATVAAYLLARALHRRFAAWWSSPLVVAPLLLIALALGLRMPYDAYARDTHWLVSMLGPATVAFALPIYDRRALLRRHWPTLAAGVLAGSAIALGSAWALASLLGVDGALRLSLLPRSISTPFAMEMSGDIGGVPDLTALFVILTGIFGAIAGDIMLRWMPARVALGRTALARGAMLGLGASGAGVAKAQQLGGDEGSVAGLVMVLSGITNVLLGPLVAWVLS